MKTGIEIIDDERKRQIEEEGHTALKDDSQEYGSIANAAAVYAMTPDKRDEFTEGGYSVIDVIWPWNDESYKPSEGNIYITNNPSNEEIGGRIHELAKAGALIAAEIDRLQRSYETWISNKNGKEIIK